MNIGLFLKNLDEEYQKMIYRGAKQEAQKLRLDLVCVQGESFEVSRGFEDSFLAAGSVIPLDGVLVLSSILIEERILSNSSYLVEIFKDKPLVSIGKEIPEALSLVVDAKESLTVLMDHLIDDHGYRRFLYIGGPQNHHDNMMRENAVRSSVEKKGLNRDKYSVTVLNNPIFGEQAGSRSIQKYIETHKERDIDVIICGNDDIAVGVHKYLKTLKDSSWENCPLTGFDDTPRASALNPPLTTIRQPLLELGRSAVRILNSRMKGEHPSLKNVVKAVPVIRQSCGCSGEKDLPETNGKSRDEKFLLPDVSRLGQTLMTADSYTDMRDMVKDFLALLVVPEYYMVYFPNPSRRFPKEGIYLGEDFERVNIKDFISRILKSHSSGTVEYSFLHLCFGEEQWGFLLYQSNERIHSVMSSMGIFLTNTLKKLHIREDEKARAKELEKLVEERTIALKEESKKRLQVEEEVLRISDLERMRFSMDLHDDICQRLATIAMLSKNAVFSSEDKNIETIAKMACDTLKQTRRYAHNSFPIELEKNGIIDALSRLCENFSEQYAISCDFSSNPPSGFIFSKQQEINIYRIVQEALQNIAVHAGATEAVVAISELKGRTVISVKDNGKGSSKIEQGYFPLLQGRRPCGLGLRSMEYRSNQMNADFKIRSSEPGGTEIKLILPKEKTDE